MNGNQLEHIQTGYTFNGDLNLAAFKQAWQQTIERHAIMRTAFIWEDLDEAQQVVYRTCELPFDVQDWRELTVQEQHERLKTYWQEERTRGFELSQVPLMRFALLRIADDTYEFVWSYHHILLDGWSMPIVLSDVFVYYEALSRGQQIQLAHIRPYQNYIEWLQQQDLQEAERFWRTNLQGFEAPTLLSGDQSVASPAEQADGYGEHIVVLPPELNQALQQLTRQQQLTLNTIVQGAWALLLSHYSGQDDVLFGATVSGRPTDVEGIEAMVGLFINTLPVRIQLEYTESLLTWLHTVQTQQMELRQYEYSPLAQVLGWSEVPRGINLFESLLVFENYPVTTAGAQEGGEASLQILGTHSQEQTNYPLTLYAIPGQQFIFKLLYDRTRFTAATVQRMLEHLVNLLGHVVTNPEAQLVSLPLVTDAEYQQIVTEWNATESTYEHLCVHQLFEARVKQKSQDIAVSCEAESLTYAELNMRANQLARHLQSLGIGPDIRVGLYIERSLEMMVGLLGILKAGGAYVPLDPTYPAERITYMLQDAQVAVLLTQERLLTSLPHTDAHVICLDRDWSTVARASVEDLQSNVTPENLMYMIYTSGSTGKPKGVMIEHRNVANFFTGMDKVLGVPESGVWLAVTSISFDISVLELF